MQQPDLIVEHATIDGLLSQRGCLVVIKFDEGRALTEATLRGP